MQGPRQKFSIGYIILAVLLFVGLQSVLNRRHEAPIAYSEFKALLRAGKVSQVVLESGTISGKFSLNSLEGLLPKERVEALQTAGGKSHDFVTTRVEDPDLVAQLEAAGVEFAGRARNPWTSFLMGWILPIVFLVLLWQLMMGRMGHQAGMGVMGIGKSKAKVYVEQSTGVTFRDVAGIDEARSELEEIVEFLRNPARYRRLGGRIPKGVLLMGAPGTGKTLLAKAVAGEAGVPFFSLSGSDFVEMFVGVGAARVRDLFTQAQQRAPAIIFIDELDALGRARAAGPIMGGHDEREQTLNQLLAEMDGFDTRKGLIILAATNRPETLDPALLRPGRFDRKIAVDRPDLKGREQILRLHSRDVTLGPGVDLATIAARTPGFVGADLANLVNEAALLAARAGKEAVDARDFDEAIDRVIAGLERKSRVLNPKEKGIVAHHEAGHALVAESRPRADRVAKISIIPRGIAALGYTQQQPTEDRYLMTRQELLDRLDVLLGGRVAEELIYGDVSTGAEDDLRRATDLARHMVTAYGMSETLGLAAFEQRRQALFLDVSLPGQREYSEQTAQAIDAEVRSLLDAAHGRVRQTLHERRTALEALALLLMQREVVDREALGELLADTETGASGTAAPATSAPASVPQRARDPVCGMQLAPAAAAATFQHAGTTYYFCSRECSTAFAAGPATYLGGRSP